jgi:hypothetical protein
MAQDIYEFYTNLEPNHFVEIDGEGYQIVMCVFINPITSDPFFTTWSPNANPEEVNCLFCEYLNEDYKESPEHGTGDATT